MLYTHLLLIFTGCGLGGLARYGTSNGIHALLGRNFPFGTLFVNVGGSLFMGFLFTLILDRATDIGPHLRAFLLIGFLGGYTTFSSFSLETILLFEDGHFLTALFNILLSVTLCVGGTWLGILLGRQ
jgi:fluoride exporter